MEGSIMFDKKTSVEKVIQFGEGGFLRGFVDWMLQYVNEKTDFNGSVAVVQPIEKGMCDMLPADMRLREYVLYMIRENYARFGFMQIETPIMYDVNHPALNKYLNKFPARQYRIQSDEKELFLRFAACFGMYLHR